MLKDLFFPKIFREKKNNNNDIENPMVTISKRDIRLKIATNAWKELMRAVMLHSTEEIVHQTMSLLAEYSISGPNDLMKTNRNKCIELLTENCKN